MSGAVIDVSELLPKGTVFRAISDGYGGGMLIAGRMVDGEFVPCSDDEWVSDDDAAAAGTDDGGALRRDCGRSEDDE